MADRLAIFVAPKIIGGRDAPTPVGGSGVRRVSSAVRLGRMEVRRLGNDVLIEAPVLRR